jgi:hypothetical protein
MAWSCHSYRGNRDELIRKQSLGDVGQLTVMELLQREDPDPERRLRSACEWRDLSAER